MTALAIAILGLTASMGLAALGVVTDRDWLLVASTAAWTLAIGLALGVLLG